MCWRALWIDTNKWAGEETIHRFEFQELRGLNLFDISKKKQRNELLNKYPIFSNFFLDRELVQDALNNLAETISKKVEELVQNKETVSIGFYGEASVCSPLIRRVRHRLVDSHLERQWSVVRNEPSTCAAISALGKSEEWFNSQVFSGCEQALDIGEERKDVGRP